MGKIKKTTRRKNTSVKRRNKTSKRNKFSKRANMKHGGLKIYKGKVIGKGGEGNAIMKVFEIDENDVLSYNAGPILETDVGKKVCLVKKIFRNYHNRIRQIGERAAYYEFLQEAAILLEMNHVNIIKLYSHGFDTNDQPYFIMDYFNCIDLRNMIREKALVATKPDGGCSKNTLSDKLASSPHNSHLFGGGVERWTVDIDIKTFILKEIFNGLNYLHEHCGLIHRDIKPENIFLNMESALIRTGKTYKL